MAFGQHRISSHSLSERRIPNYNLEKCHNTEPLFQSARAITLSPSFRSFAYRLWDEQRHRLVGFGDLRSLRRQ
jgi:omega-6 fatty acid desaturase (delta-12 desaturase)